MLYLRAEEGGKAWAKSERSNFTCGHYRVLVEVRFRASHLMSWARLLRRVFALDLEHCPNRGGELKTIAAILEQPVVIEKILTHLGLQDRAPPRAAERGQLLQAA